MHIKKAKKLRMVSTGAFCALGVIGFLGVFPITKTSDDAEATVTPATTTLTMTSSSTTASVDVTPASSNGTFATSAAADEVAFTVTTNNVTGYNLTIAGSDSTRQLNNTDVSATLDSITTATDQTTFTTGAAATYNNKWGYKPSMYNSAANTDYLQAPTTAAETLNQTTSANTTADSYTIGLGARVDYTKPVGTYTNTFVIEAVANNVAYQINYLDDSGDSSVTGLPAAEGSQVSTVSAFTLDTGTPTRTGYTFQGWCYGTADYTTDPTGCTGTTYQAGDNFVFTSYSSTSTNTADLYAMWEQELDKLYMQDMDLTQCTTAGVTAYDRRDEKAYTVKKLNDNNCWMVENLRLDLSTVSLANLQGTTSAPNTNANNTTLTYLKNGGGSSPYPANGVIAKTATGGSWTNDYANPYIATQYENTTQAASGSAPAGTIGIYYNYCAASAGSYCYAANASSGDASQDICPAGWHLPTGGASGQYQALYTAYSSNVANFESALSTPLSGSFDSGAAYDQGSYGYFWSSTRYNGRNMYSLLVYASAVLPQGYYYRYYGFSVRCVMKQTTMQNFSAADKAAMSTGDTRTLIDARDGKTYTVGKLADGNVWMKENLRLDISDAAVQTMLNSTTTNATDTALGYLKNGGGSGQYPANGVIAKTATGGSWTNDYANPYIATQYENTVQPASGSAPAGTIGIYYNYCAASAGSYCYATNASSGDASEDICPAGWHLPTDGASGQYQALYTAYSSNVANFESALSTPLSGIFEIGSAYDQGTTGGFWSSTRSDGDIMYGLGVGASTVYLHNSHFRNIGFSVRCVFGS